MTAPRRRNDPDDVDFSDTRNGFSWKLPWNLGAFAGKGSVAIFALMVVGSLVTTAAFAYVAWKGLEDHRAMMRSNDRLACIVSMTTEERTKFRAGGGHWSQWCPWLMNGNGH